MLNVAYRFPIVSFFIHSFRIVASIIHKYLCRDNYVMVKVTVVSSYVGIGVGTIEM